MKYQTKLIGLSASYPDSVILYPQDIKKLMKLPGRIPGIFDKQLFDFLKFTNGASILDYCFYGFKNHKLKIGFDDNLMNKWVSFVHIAGTVIPFMSNSCGLNFGYLKDTIVNESHPIVFFTQFKEETSLVAPNFESFFETFLDCVEMSLRNGNSVDIEVTNWPHDFEFWKLRYPEIANILANEDVNTTIKNLKA